MTFYADISTTDKRDKLALVVASFEGDEPIAITFTNRPYARIDYYGKWADFKKWLEDRNLERYKFKRKESE